MGYIPNNGGTNFLVAISKVGHFFINDTMQFGALMNIWVLRSSFASQVEAAGLLAAVPTQLLWPDTCSAAVVLKPMGMSCAQMTYPFKEWDAFRS
jgi:hypothetical protein